MTQISKKYIEDICNGFQNNKGKGYCNFNSSVKLADVINEIIKKYKEKNPDSNILFVVDTYERRKELNSIIYNKDYTGINAITYQYFNSKFQYVYDFIIIVNIPDILMVKYLMLYSKFMLYFVINFDSNFNIEINKLLPFIKSNITVETAKTAKIYTPVEEHWIGVDFTNVEDIAKYNKCTEYINDSIKILGSLDNIQKCKYGDSTLGISADSYRDAVARNNGWSPDLDTNIEYLRNIDTFYNPNVLYERACNFYNIARERRDVVANNADKLDVIYDLINRHKNEKILIVSKSGEFATKINDYVLTKDKEVFITPRIGEYHDNIESCIATDNEGYPILIKSGEHKGQPKIVGAQAISTINMNRFNANNINILSMKSASNNKLRVNADVIIFTSPLYDNIFDFKIRFNNIEFNDEKTLVYKLFVNKTVEEITLSKQKPTNLITVINETNSEMMMNEENGEIIL